MNLSRTYLERSAAGTGYLPETLEKVTHLGEIASAIGQHPFLRTRLALKGGTALNLCLVESPARLSVDLDYNYVGHEERAAMLGERPRIEEAIVVLLKRLGYRLQHSAEAFAGRKLYASFPSVFGTEGRVELDLNFLGRIPLKTGAGKRLWQPGELDRRQVIVVSLEELCLGKMLAFLDRSAPRDAWDIAHLPDVAADILATPLFRVLFVAFSATLPHPLNTYTREKIASRMTVRTVSEQLWPMLATNSKPDQKALIEQAWGVMEPFLRLWDNEEQYIKSIHEGNVRASLIADGDAALGDLITRHPAIRWKVENVLKSSPNP